jgi:hypothetical protein
MRELVGSNELRGARIRDCDLSGAVLRGVDLSRVVVTDAWLFGADISGAIGGLRINGVEVEPLIEAELDRRHPERAALRPTDVDGILAAFDVVEAMWAPTIERARRLPPERLHERVGGEYSFLETLRHLLFALDAWALRMVLRTPNATHEWGVPPDLPVDAPPADGPDLDEVLAVRTEHLQLVRDHVATMSPADLTTPVAAPDPVGHPQGVHRPLDCLRIVLREEWWHHQYAIRDLAVLEAR